MPAKPKRRVKPVSPLEDAPERSRGGVLDRMRRRQKLFLVILTSALLVPFGAYGVVQQLMGTRRGPDAGTAYGERVRATEFNRLHDRLALAQRIWTARMGRDLPSVANEQVWDRLLYLHEARAMRLGVSAKEVDDLLSFYFPDAKGEFSREQFERFLMRPGVPDEEEVRATLADDLLAGGVLTLTRAQFFQMQYMQYLPTSDFSELRLRLGSRLERALLSGLAVTDEEVWSAYLNARREYEAAYLPFRPDRFLALVAPPTQADQDAWYKTYKDQTPAESDIGVGYKVPMKVSVAYFTADPQDFRARVKVSERELRDYYERNKHEFRVTTQPATQPTTQPATQPTTQPTTTSGAATQAATTTQAATRPTTGPAAEFQPFEEVRDKVLAEVTDRKAREEALRAVKAAGTARISADATVDADLIRIARRFNVRYAPPTGLLTAEEVQNIQALKGAADPTGKTLDRFFFDRIDYNYADVTMPGGTAFHVWRAYVRKEHVLTQEEAKDEIIHDIRAHRAYELAVAHAKELLTGLKSLAASKEPLEVVGKRQGPPIAVEPVAPFTLSEAKYAPTRAAAGATAAERDRVLRGVLARTIEAENLGPGAAAVAVDPIERVAYLMRVVRRTDPSLDEFRADTAHYRRVALERKRNAFMQHWMAEVRKRAAIEEREGFEGRIHVPEHADYGD
jgi:heme exporter protein D